MLYTRIYKTVSTCILFVGPLCFVTLFNFANCCTRTPCEYAECCSDSWILSSSSHITGLEKALQKRLYGQHLVHSTVIPALRGFFSGVHPPKPLVLSFHGRTGVGKNHVARIIAESMYREGLDSQYVHLKKPMQDYPFPSELESYKEDLQSLILSNVRMCPRQLFIFDEIENFPAGLLDVIKPYLDYNYRQQGVDFRKSVFIFLSNVAGREITEATIENTNALKTRESIQLHDMEMIVQEAAYSNKDSGFYRSRLIDSYLVSHFIPFLPLERDHVRQCIRDEFRKYDPTHSSTDDINSVMKSLLFFPEETDLYSLKGCKNVVEKVNLVLFRNVKTEL